VSPTSRNPSITLVIESAEKRPGARSEPCAPARVKRPPSGVGGSQKVLKFGGGPSTPLGDRPCCMLMRDRFRLAENTGRRVAPRCEGGGLILHQAAELYPLAPSRPSLAARIMSCVFLDAGFRDFAHVSVTVNEGVQYCLSKRKNCLHTFPPPLRSMAVDPVDRLCVGLLSLDTGCHLSAAIA